MDYKKRKKEVRALRKKAIKIQNSSSVKVSMVEAIKMAGRREEDEKGQF
jgi:hypothetical protein